MTPQPSYHLQGQIQESEVPVMIRVMAELSSLRVGGSEMMIEL
jgi:hypothetical protein